MADRGYIIKGVSSISGDPYSDDARVLIEYPDGRTEWKQIGDNVPGGSITKIEDKGISVIPELRRKASGHGDLVEEDEYTMPLADYKPPQDEPFKWDRVSPTDLMAMLRQQTAVVAKANLERENFWENQQGQRPGEEWPENYSLTSTTSPSPEESETLIEEIKRLMSEENAAFEELGLAEYDPLPVGGSQQYKDLYKKFLKIEEED